MVGCCSTIAPQRPCEFSALTKVLILSSLLASWHASSCLKMTNPSLELSWKMDHQCMARRPNQVVLQFFHRGKRCGDKSDRYKQTCKARGEILPKGGVETHETSGERLSKYQRAGSPPSTISSSWCKDRSWKLTHEQRALYVREWNFEY